MSTAHRSIGIHSPRPKAQPSALDATQETEFDTGAAKELIFDSKLTTYANINTLNDQKINFITL